MAEHSGQLDRQGDSTPPVSISVFFPCYNEQDNVPKVAEQAIQVLDGLHADYEVIIVDDGSSDNTAAVADRIAAANKRVRVVHHPHNRGYGAALQSGFRAAAKELVFYTDGDGQYDPSELPLLLELCGPKTGLVNGFKLSRQDPLHRIWIGSTYNFCARLLFRIRIRDIDCDYRLIRRALLDRIKLTSTRGTICVELVRKLELSGCEVKEVGVHHYPRLHGRSQFFRVRSLAITFGQLLRLWFRLVVLR
jgi:glycosyltransferase involved in cell wall biosynthesis